MIFLKSEPVGESYLALLSLLVRHCAYFSLVLKRSKHGRHKSAQEIEDALAPHLMLEEETRQWPGTLLLPGAGVARLGLYRAEPGAMDVLRSVDGLYQWCLPWRPEDLAFYTADGTCFFSSTSHETEGMVGSASVSEDDFRRQVPGVAFKWYPGSRG